MKRISTTLQLCLITALCLLAGSTALAAGPASAATSTITSSTASIVANGLATAFITVQLKDGSGTDLTSGSASITLQTTAGRLGGVVNNNDGTYTARLVSSLAIESATVTGTLDGSPITDQEIVSFIQGAGSIATSTITPGVASLTANGIASTTVRVDLKNGAGDVVTGNVGVVTLTASTGRLSSVEIDTVNGTYTSIYTAPTSVGGGSATISGTLAGQALAQTATITLTPSPLTGYYRTVASGNWSDPAIWEVYTGSAWESAAAIDAPSPTNADGVITIEGGHTVVVDADVEVDELVVQPTAVLTSSAGHFSIYGSENTVFGTVTVSAGSRMSIDEMNIYGGSLILDEGSILAPLTASSIVHTYDISTVSAPLTADFNTQCYIERGTTTVTSPTAECALKGGLYYVGRSNGVPAALIIPAGKHLLMLGTLTVRPLGNLQGPGTMTFSGDNGNSEVLLTNNGTISADVTFHSDAGNNQLFQGTKSPGATYVWNNVTIDNPGGVTLRYSSGYPDAVINGTLTLQGGTFMLTGLYGLGTDNVRFGENAKIVRADGALSKSPLFGNTIDVAYTGSAPTTTGFELPPLASVLHDLSINTAAGVTLGDNITVNHAITCSTGSIHTNEKTITLASTASVVESAGRNIDGTVQITTPIGTGGAANLGGLGVTVGAGADDAGELTVTRATGASGTLSVNTKTGIAASWLISTTNPLPAGRAVSISWLSDFDNSYPLTAARVWASTDVGSTWTDLSGSDQNFSGRLVSVSHSALNVLYTVVDNAEPLPVELTSFTSSVRGRTVLLSWKTSTEKNNYGFEIERSAAHNVQWKKIGFVEGSGTSNAPKTYSFSESNLTHGTYSYRLKQVDRDGAFAYSAVIEADVAAVPDAFGLSQNYPNPFNPTTTIAFALPEFSAVSLKIYDTIGREIASIVQNSLEAGYYSFPFDGTHLSSGVYLYRLQAAHGGSVFTQTKRFVLMK